MIAVGYPATSTNRDNVGKYDANHCHEQYYSDCHPEQRIPERTYLPAEMEVKIFTVRITSLYVVDDNNNNRRPASKEGRNDKC